MSRQVVLEVTSPYHADGRTVLYSPGQQFPLGTDLPPDVRVREVVAEVPDAPVKAAAPAEPVKPAVKAPSVKH
jgi:hypothetical protein